MKKILEKQNEPYIVAALLGLAFIILVVFLKFGAS